MAFIVFERAVFNRHCSDVRLKVDFRAVIFHEVLPLWVFLVHTIKGDQLRGKHSDTLSFFTFCFVTTAAVSFGVLCDRPTQSSGYIFSEVCFGSFKKSCDMSFFCVV